MRRWLDGLRRHAIGSVALLPFGVSWAAPASIEYQVVSLGVPHRCEVRYTVSNVSLPSALSRFPIDFDTALHEEDSLLVVPPGPSGWNERILGSVSDLGIPAQHDAHDTVGPALGRGDTANGFTVQFTWLRSGAPGAQVFAAYDPGSLEVLASGLTTRAGEEPPPPIDVPEPATAALALTGVHATRRRAMAFEPQSCSCAAAA